MKTLGIIDIGTNSIRLAVVRIEKDHGYKTLALHKEAVRLGEGEFAHNRITRPAMERSLVVLKKFADIARRSGAEEIKAIGTAALREAQNRSEFTERALSECGVDVRVISGLEEARLIYLGVSSGVDLNSNRGLFVDIGGGTTELIIGDAKEYYLLESLKLGAVRLNDIFLKGHTGSVSKKKYSTMVDYAREVGNLAFRKVREEGFDVVYGSSGTIINLAEITARRLGTYLTTIRNYTLSYSDLCETISMLCSLDLDARKEVAGINPERADIIVSGAAILDSFMTETGANAITVSTRAVRDGVLIDYIFQEESIREEYLSTSVRLRSVLQLCRSCRFEESHSEHVVKLALSIFDQMREMGLHPYGEKEAEMLRYAAMCHDVGTFISLVDHHKHTYYLVRNWNLLGFDDQEIEILATIAMCHRKAFPRKVWSPKLSSSAKRMIEVLASILRIADALDRGQIGCVDEVKFKTPVNGKKLFLEVYANEDCPLEMKFLDYKKVLFEQTFEVKLDAEMIVRQP